MNKYLTKYPNIFLYEDMYPFTESKKILETLTDWNTLDTRKSYVNKSDNYKLDTTDKNSIVYSFENRLKTGSLVFLYHNETVISYCGCRYQDNIVYASRYRTNPMPLPKDLVGVHLSVLLPFIFYKGYINFCNKFRMSFNAHNLKIYNFITSGRYKKFRQKLPLFPGLDNIVDLFIDEGKQTVLNMDQYVITVDLLQHKQKIVSHVNDEFLSINNLSLTL